MLLAPRKEEVRSEDRLGNVDDFSLGSTRLFAKHLERLLVGDAVALHEDPFSSFGDGSPGERALQGVVLGETTKHDVDGTLKLGLVFAAGEVGEDALGGRLIDEFPVLNVEQGNHWTRGLSHDLSDARQGALRTFFQDGDGDIGMGPSGYLPEVSYLAMLLKNLVAKSRQGVFHVIQERSAAVDDENPQSHPGPYITNDGHDEPLSL